MKQSLLIVPVLFVALIAGGCATGGMFPSSHVTEVQLQKGNFTIVARNVTGEAQAEYLLGVSFSMGIASNTFALLRIGGSGMLYKDALEDFWKNYESKYGPVEGKKIALVNVRYDSESLNLYVYTRPRVVIRADVIEFTE